MSNEELGLSPTNESDYEVHYNTLYDIRECGITTEKKRKCSLWLDESNELAINYENLKRFSKAVFKGASAPAVCAKAIVTFDSVLYKKTEHCKMIHGDCGSFKQSYLHFESDAKAEEHAKMNGFRYFMRCKLTEGCTYWFLPDKVRRQDSRIATDPHDAAYNCVSWELC
jgi:hypothetical protein